MAYANSIDQRNHTNIQGETFDIILLIVYVLLALAGSFVCSIAEAVLLCITPTYIESLRMEHPNRAKLLRKLRQESVDQSFAAILTLNTIAHTVGAIMAGIQAKAVFGNIWIGLFSAFMTLMILFVSEIIPKTIGAVYWKRLVKITAFLIRGMVYALYPIVWLSEKLTKLIGHGSVAHIFSRDEMIAMAEVGKQGGYIDQHESRIFRNLFRLNTLTVTDIMTPRVVVSALPQDMVIAEALKTSERIPFSRLPVYGQDIDDITGFVLKDQILLMAAQDKPEVKLEALKRNVPAVPETLSLSKLLEDMLTLHQHIAIVVDEYGGTAGIVTLEDVLETLLGIEISDEMDDVEDMRLLARQRWEKRAKKLGINLENEKAEQSHSADAGKPHR
jgi:CBS domain containing-hemolysin-like protein